MDRTAAFEEHRGLLFGVAYRMLGSASDAEDVVQEAFLRWERAAAPEIASPKAFLSTVVVRLAIDHLRAARTHAEYVGPWLPEPLVDEAVASPADELVLAESLSMAFLVVLERLDAVERAVFILREVFDYDYDEIASVVGKTREHCRQLLHRARERIVGERRRPAVSCDEQKRLTQQFLATIATGDVRALAAMLADDVVLWSDGGGKRVAARNPIRGAMRVARFFAGIWKKAPPGITLRLARVNGQPGVVTYLGGRPYHVMVFDVADGRVAAVRAVVNPDKLRRVPPLH